jgi:hypothetical protein
MSLPPADALKELVDRFKLAQAVYVAAELGLADLLAGGPRPCDELAAETGTHPPTLYRLLRALAAGGLFREEANGVFSLAPLGGALRADAQPSLRDWVLHVARPLNWNTWSALLDSVRTGENAFVLVHGEDTWSHRAARPGEQEAFDRGMAALTRRLDAALLEAYDFGRFGTVVDVGGGNGALLSALLAANPGMRGVLFDQPHVVAGAQVGDRCETVGGDFFEAVPAGGDAYVLKSITHDWEDADVLRILRSCRRAAAPGASLLVVERDLGRPNEDLEAKVSDLNMLVLPGGRERSEHEFAELLGSAGFRYAGAVPVTGAFHLFEGVVAE